MIVDKVEVEKVADGPNGHVTVKFIANPAGMISIQQTVTLERKWLIEENGKFYLAVTDDPDSDEAPLSRRATQPGGLYT